MATDGRHGGQAGTGEGSQGRLVAGLPGVCEGGDEGLPRLCGGVATDGRHGGQACTGEGSQGRLMAGLPGVCEGGDEGLPWLCGGVATDGRHGGQAGTREGSQGTVLCLISIPPRIIVMRYRLRDFDKHTSPN